MSDGFDVIIPAAGLGTRFGGEVRKQYLQLKGQSLLERVLKIFLQTKVLRIVVVCPESDLDFVARDVEGLSSTLHFCAGGKTRAESVKNGFCFLERKDDDIVLIHDAARPLVSPILIDSVYKAALQYGAAVPGLALADTIKQVENGFCYKTLNRDCLRAIQTPQGFQVEILRRAYTACDVLDPQFTDEASLVEVLGIKPFIVEGERDNIKITNPSDLVFAQKLLG